MSKTKKWTVGGLTFIALVFAFYLGTGYQENKQMTAGIPNTTESSGGTTVVYACDGGKAINTTYYTNKAVTGSVDNSTPDGWVKVSFDGAPSVTLNQTVSADGARYANSDESLVFWSKGDEALVLNNNTMDLTYTNCKAS